MGGAPGQTNNIDYIQIASTGNAQDFGHTEYAGGSVSGTASATRMVAGGAGSYTDMSTIQFASK